MPISDYFAGTYDEARSKFVSAVNSKGAILQSYILPNIKGPRGESLITDIAMIGATSAENVLLIISGTHGVEGFAGSGCQVGMLQDEIFNGLPSNLLLILVHSLNPYGFAWLRRVNEDNVDLNRNFLDFRGQLPNSSEYEELHDLLVPSDWEGAIRHEADLALQQYIKRRGLKSFQAAVQKGQYSKPDGLFYGGVKEAWSNTTLHQIIKNQIPKTMKKLACIDIHTGLGQSGYGELIYIGSSEVDYHRCIQWFGEGVTNPIVGGSVSAKVLGTVTEAFTSLSSGVELCSVALEFGTRPVMEVLEALRADHWLHSRGNGQEYHSYNKLKDQILKAFYEDTNHWKAAIYSKTLSTIFEVARKIDSK